MSRRKTGHVFIIIACILISINLISNAIIISGIEDYELLKKVSSKFTNRTGINLGITCFIIGIAYLVYAEIGKD